MLKLKRLRLENRKGASQNVAPLSQLSEKVQNVNSTFLVVFIFHGRWETQSVITGLHDFSVFCFQSENQKNDFTET